MYFAIHSILPNSITLPCIQGKWCNVVYTLQSQLSDAKKQIAAHAKRAVSDEVVLANKEAEIGQLSKKLQELEDQLQGHTATSNEDMEEQRVDEIMIQISDLRVCLAESKGEKEEMEASMEADQMQQREEQNWMEALDKTVQVSWAK